MDRICTTQQNDKIYFTRCDPNDDETPHQSNASIQQTLAKDTFADPQFYEKLPPGNTKRSHRMAQQYRNSEEVFTRRPV